MGYMSRYLAEQKRAARRGIPFTITFLVWVRQIKRRELMLEKARAIIVREAHGKISNNPVADAQRARLGKSRSRSARRSQAQEGRGGRDHNTEGSAEE